MRLEEKEYTKSFDYSIWKRIFPFLKPYKKTVIMILVMNLFCSLVDIILPLFQRYAINHFIEGNTLTGIGFFTVLYIVVIALQGAAVIAFTRGSMRIEMGLGKDLKRALFVHLQTLSFSYYNVTPVGYMLSRVMNDTGKISGLTRLELRGSSLGSHLCAGCFCGYAFPELETGAGHHAGGTCHRPSDFLLPEPDSQMEPAGA